MKEGEAKSAEKAKEAEAAKTSDEEKADLLRSSGRASAS